MLDQARVPVRVALALFKESSGEVPDPFSRSTLRVCRRVDASPRIPNPRNALHRRGRLGPLCARLRLPRLSEEACLNRSRAGSTGQPGSWAFSPTRGLHLRTKSDGPEGVLGATGPSGL